jgi:hypothetical protein
MPRRSQAYGESTSRRDVGWVGTVMAFLESSVTVGVRDGAWLRQGQFGVAGPDLLEAWGASLVGRKARRHTPLGAVMADDAALFRPTPLLPGRDRAAIRYSFY